MKMFLKKFLSLLLNVLLVIPFFSIWGNNSLAEGSMKVTVGNMEYGHTTNMVIEYTLGGDLTCVPPASTLFISFDHNIMPTTFTSNDVNVELDDGSDANMRLGFSGSNYLYFYHDEPGCTTLPAGTVVIFYLGRKDNYNTGYSTGYDDTKFNSSATLNFTNYTSGVLEGVTFDSGASYNEGNGEYMLIADSPTSFISGVNEKVPLSGNVDPYIQLAIDSNSSSFNIDGSDFQTDTVGIHLATNAEDGYSLKYRSTPLANVSDPLVFFTTAPDLVLGSNISGWGINVAIDSYDLNINGAETMVKAQYDDPDKYTIVTNGSFQPLLYVDDVSPGPANIDSTLKIGVSSSGTQPGGHYQGTITFNMFGYF